MKKIPVWIVIGLLISSLTANSVAAADAVGTDVLAGKTALFIGDSITYGYMDSAPSPRAWAYRLQSDYQMIVTNRGQNGHSLSDVRDYSTYGGQDKRLHTKCFDNARYDYVILQGGVNDIIGAEPNKGHPQPGVAAEVGQIATTKELTDFDTSTFAGGLERYFYEATTRYPHARIGFIITYRTPNSTWGGRTLDADEYWDVARQICDKWDVPYLDLYDDRYSIDLLRVNTNDYLADGLHLNAGGYTILTEVIAEWMASLQPYGEETVSVPTTTTADRHPTTATKSTASTPRDDAAAQCSTSTASSSTASTSDIAVSDTTSSDVKTTASSFADDKRTDEESAPAGGRKNDKPNYAWLIAVLSAAVVAVLATVITVAVRSRVQKE